MHTCIDRSKQIYSQFQPPTAPQLPQPRHPDSPGAPCCFFFGFSILKLCIADLVCHALGFIFLATWLRVNHTRAPCWVVVFFSAKRLYNAERFHSPSHCSHASRSTASFSLPGIGRTACKCELAGTSWTLHRSN